MTMVKMMLSTSSTAPTMIAATAQPFLTPAFLLCTSATMPRISPTSEKKNDSDERDDAERLARNRGVAGAP